MLTCHWCKEPIWVQEAVVLHLTVRGREFVLYLHNTTNQPCLTEKIDALERIYAAHP